MSKLGSRVAQVRKSKGLSQEALAEKAGLNLRTIQRIEKGEPEARGDSIRRISCVLEVGPEDLMNNQMTENRGYLAAINLSSLTCFLHPMLGVLIPLILWLFKKDKSPAAKEVGRQLINFEITWCIVYYLTLFVFAGNFIFEIKFNSVNNSPGTLLACLWPIIITYVLKLIQISLVIMNSLESYREGRVVFYPGLPFIK